MSVKITDNTRQIANQKQQAGSLFLRLMLDVVEGAADPKTPRRGGQMRQNKRKQVLGLHAKLAWLVHYAIFQEVKQYVNYTTPGTGPHFARDAVAKGIASTSAVARKARLI